MENPNNQIEQQLFTLLRRGQAIHLTTSSGDVQLERSGYGILCLIADEGPQRLGTIASSFRLDPSTITRQVQAVVELGLASKATDYSDRRALLLTLTPDGEQVLRRTRSHRRDILDQVMGDWTLEERAQFGRSLTRFNETLDAWVKSSGEQV